MKTCVHLHHHHDINITSLLLSHDLSPLAPSHSLVSNLAAAVSSSPPSESEGLEGWAIALIVIGCLVAVAAIVGGVFYAKKKDWF